MADSSVVFKLRLESLTRHAILQSPGIPRESSTTMRQMRQQQLCQTQPQRITGLDSLDTQRCVGKSHLLMLHGASAPERALSSLLSVNVNAASHKNDTHI
jgi:hypothetical protein